MVHIPALSNTANSLSHSEMTGQGAPSKNAKVRQRIFRALTWRNRLIQFLRWAIPAIGIALALFLIAQIIIANIAEQYGVQGINIEGEKIAIETPKYSGVMSDGTTYDVEAQSASVLMSDTDKVDLNTATLRTLDPNNYAMVANAEFALLNLADQTVTIPDKMFTSDSDGVDGELHKAFVDWKNQKITADSFAQFDFPDGAQITADSMVFFADRDVWRFTQARYELPNEDSQSPQTIVGDDLTVGQASKDVVTAQKLVVREQDNIATFSENVVVTRPDLKVWADVLKVRFEGTNMQKVSNFEALGNVKMQDAVQTATSDYGTYDPNSSIMNLTGNVVVKTDSGTVKAPSLTSNLDTHISTFTRQDGTRVSGDFKSDNNVKILSDRFEIRESENIAIFSGNVIADQADTRIWADRIIVYLGVNEGDDIRFYEAIGNVKVKDPDQTSTGDRGRYNPDTGKMELSGNVVVKNDSGTVESEQLNLDLDSNVTTFTSNGNGRVSGVFSPDKSPNQNGNGGNGPIDLQ